MEVNCTAEDYDLVPMQVSGLLAGDDFLKH